MVCIQLKICTIKLEDNLCLFKGMTVFSRAFRNRYTCITCSGNILSFVLYLVLVSTLANL